MQTPTVSLPLRHAVRFCTACHFFIHLYGQERGIFNEQTNKTHQSAPRRSHDAETAAFLDAVDVDYAYDLTYKLSTDPAYLTNEMGFRTSGSDAEHAAADFLAEEMTSIGLTDVLALAEQLRG